jgi:hypothetical protein
MNRRHWIFVVMLVGACGRRAAAPAFAQAVAGVWKLKSIATFPASSAPELVRQIGTREWWSATYEGPGPPPGWITAEVYELTATAGGLEMAQKWRAAPDAVVWYTPRYFIVVKWRNTDRPAVGAFIRALEKQFTEEK